MADEKVEIEIVLDDGSVQKGFLKVEQQAKKTADKVDNSFNLKGALGAVAGLAAAFGAFKAIGFLKDFAKESVANANQQNEAIAKFNTSLALTGKLLPGVSKSFQDYANSLQEATKFGDDAVLETAALIQQLANLEDKSLRRATAAALDLSSALGIDLSSATTLVAKGATGAVESFSRYGVQIKKGATETETLNNLLTTLEKKFGGAAAAAVNTFGGAQKQLSNTFGDFQEQFGKVITQSPAIIALFKVISKGLGTLTKNLSSGSVDFAKDFIINFSVVAQAGIVTAQKIGDGFVLAWLRATKAWQVFKNVTTLGLSDAFQDQLIQTNMEIDAILNKDYDNSPLIKFFDDLIMKVSATNGKLLEFGENGVANLTTLAENPAATTFGQNIGFIGEAFDFSSNKAALSTDQIIATNAKLKATFIDIGVQARNQLGNGIGNAFAKVGEAFVKGENALKAFAQAFIGAIGQMAIQSGTRFILEGLAYLTVPGFQGVGGSMIAAGAALATFGGVISALAGGGGESTSAAGGGASATAESSLVNEDALASVEEKTTSVKIDVTGQVLNPIEVGNQLAQILNDAFSAGGTKVVTA